MVPALGIGGLSLSTVIGEGQKTTAEDASVQSILIPKS
jgi:hypothetical protein